MNDVSVPIERTFAPAGGPAIAGSASSRTRGRKRPSFKETVALIKSDIAYRCIMEDKPPTTMRMLRMLQNPGICTVVRYRLQCYFMANHMRPLGHLLKWYNVAVYSTFLDENSRIGPCFVIGHPCMTTVSGDVEMGERCVLYINNTVSPSQFFEPGKECGPVLIGNNVQFGMGSCAHGHIMIGDDCQIGCNAAVDRSFPAGSVLFGVPARAVGKAKDSSENAG